MAISNRYPGGLQTRAGVCVFSFTVCLTPRPPHADRRRLISGPIWLFTMAPSGATRTILIVLASLIHDPRDLPIELSRVSGIDATTGLAFRPQPRAFKPFFGTTARVARVALTGRTSDPRAFRNLQKITLRALGLIAYPGEAANSSGGVMAQMIGITRCGGPALTAA